MDLSYFYMNQDIQIQSLQILCVLVHLLHLLRLLIHHLVDQVLENLARQKIILLYYQSYQPQPEWFVLLADHLLM